MTDYESQVRDAFPELDEFEREDLREKTVECWTLALERGGWRDIQDIPHTWNIADPNTVDHLRGVYQIAMAGAEIQKDIYGVETDLEVLRAIALTHDVGKALEYTSHVDDELLDDPDPGYAGEAIPHQLSGYAIAQDVGLPQAVLEAIPHGPYELPDPSFEYAVIEAANEISSNAMTMAAMDLTLEEWTAQYH